MGDKFIPAASNRPRMATAAEVTVLVVVLVPRQLVSRCVFHRRIVLHDETNTRRNVLGLLLCLLLLSFFLFGDTLTFGAFVPT